MKNIILLLVTMVHSTMATAQDLHFSQFPETPLLRNPALAGIFTGQFRLQAVFRDQWRSIRGVNNSARPYRTMGAGLEVKLTGYCMGENALILGFQVTHDRAGDAILTRTLPMVSLSYRQYITESIALTGGFYGGWVASSFNTNGLQWDDQYVNGAYSPLNPTSQPLPLTDKDYLDVGAGFVCSNLSTDYNNWYLGLAVHHPYPVHISFAHEPEFRIYPRITINTAYATTVQEFNKLKLCMDVMFQGGQYQVLGGLIYTLRVRPEDDVEDNGLSLGFGLLGRLRDALIPLVKINLNQFTAGISYDFTTSRSLSNATGGRGGIELTLKYRGISRDTRKSDCGGYGCILGDY